MDEKDNATGPAHHPGTRKGEELVQGEGKESGLHDAGTTGADRPAGTSSARSATGINPDDENPIDPASPNMPPD